MRIQYLIFSLFSVFISCNTTSQSELKEVGRFILKIDEPSGITADGQHLFIVSDNNGKVYKTDFQGKVLDDFDTDVKDLEGITYNPFQDELAVVSESKRKIFVFDKDGSRNSDSKIKGKQESENSGLEGVTFNTSNKSYYVANEKKPKQILKLDSDFEIVSKFKLNFLHDVSGLCYDATLDAFWVVSDESRSIFKISTQGEMLAAYSFNLKQMEGIACHGDKLYVVSDAVEVLVVFEKPD